MSPTLATFLFELVNFLLLAALLGWLLFKPVRQRIEARQAAERQRESDVAARIAEADRLRADWQHRHDAFEQEASQARAARLTAAEQEANAIVARAREAGVRERERAATALAQVEQVQLRKLADAVATATRDAVARLLTTIDAPDLERSLIQSACRRLEALDASPGAVVVESARPLTDRDRQLIIAALGTPAVVPAFRVVPGLGAGLRVTTVRGLIDASAVGIADEAERRLKSDLVVESTQAKA